MDQYLGEVRAVAFSYAPRGWALCNGQILPINQNQALFALLGTTYGGNGTTTFALPNLQGKTPVHVGPDQVLGSTGGESGHSLTLSEMPLHNHPPMARNQAGDANSPADRAWGLQPDANLYVQVQPATPLNPTSVATVGAGTPHDNWSPYLVINFIIALTGIFPSRN
jgi:microcystin-dependent protein